MVDHVRIMKDLLQISVVYARHWASNQLYCNIQTPHQAKVTTALITTNTQRNLLQKSMRRTLMNSTTLSVKQDHS
jgi:hypothetical protein